MKKNFPILYKYTSRKQIQQWQIFVEDDKFYTTEGIKDGKLTTSLPTVCKGKNPGKKNATTAHEQACKEAAAKFQKKLDRGYNEVLTEEKKFFDPMLAQKYDPEAELEFPVYVQPKLDGIRAINQDNIIMSRWGKRLLAGDILAQNEVILDGELYNHGFKDDFNRIASLFNANRKTFTVEEETEIIRYAEMHVYDFPGHDGPFSERYEKLSEWVKSCSIPGIVLVPTQKVSSTKGLKMAHKRFLDQGYEGTIIRLDTGPYERGKRSKQLLKMKDFVDEEFVITGYEEGKGGRTGTIGKFILQHDINPKQTFECNVKGDFTYLRKVWADRDMYIGKTATVQYKNRTPLKADGTGNVPRHGYIIKLDRESYE